MIETLQSISLSWRILLLYVFIVPIILALMRPDLLRRVLGKKEEENENQQQQESWNWVQPGSNTEVVLMVVLVPVLVFLLLLWVNWSKRWFVKKGKKLGRAVGLDENESNTVDEDSEESSAKQNDENGPPKPGVPSGQAGSGGGRKSPVEGKPGTYSNWTPPGFSQQGGGGNGNWPGGDGYGGGGPGGDGGPGGGRGVIPPALFKNGKANGKKQGQWFGEEEEEGRGWFGGNGPPPPPGGGSAALWMDLPANGEDFDTELMELLSNIKPYETIPEGEVEASHANAQVQQQGKTGWFLGKGNTLYLNLNRHNAEWLLWSMTFLYVVFVWLQSGNNMVVSIPNEATTAQEVYVINPENSMKLLQGNPDPVLDNVDQKELDWYCKNLGEIQFNSFDTLVPRDYSLKDEAFLELLKWRTRLPRDFYMKDEKGAERDAFFDVLSKPSKNIFLRTHGFKGPQSRILDQDKGKQLLNQYEKVESKLEALSKNVEEQGSSWLPEAINKRLKSVRMPPVQIVQHFMLSTINLILTFMKRPVATTATLAPKGGSRPPGASAGFLMGLTAIGLMASHFLSGGAA